MYRLAFHFSLPVGPISVRSLPLDDATAIIFWITTIVRDIGRHYTLRRLRTLTASNCTPLVLKY